MVLLPSAITCLYRLLPKPYRRKLVSAGANVFVMACVDLISLGILLPILLLVLSENNIAENPYLSYAFRIGGFKNNQMFVGAVCLVIFSISLGRTLFNTYMQYCQSKRLFEISSYISMRLYQLYYSKGFLYIKQNNSHHLINKVNAVAINLIQGYFIPFTSFICEFLVVMFILIGLVLFNVYVFLLVFLTFVPISLIYYRYSRSRIKKYGEFLFKIFPQKTKLLQQTFVGYADMEMNNLFPVSEKKYSKLLSEQNYYTVRNIVMNSSLQRVLEFAVICSVIVLIMMTQLFELPSLGIVVGLFVIAIYRILPGIVKATSYYFTMRSNTFALKLLDELEHSDGRIENPIQREITFNYSIRFDSVSFSYDKNTLVIHNFSLEIKKGDFIGIKGESGCGKSTLFHLLLGFLSPDAGNIYIDNTVLSAEYMISWHSRIGYVSQQLFMIEGSLLDNIVMGVDGICPDRTRIYEVLKLSSLDKFVDSLPEGLETPVGEGGCLLSGGQRQRLGIARALYKKADILLFDEATSSLDENTEKTINQAIVHLSELRRDLTLLVISHRMESLSICQTVICLEKQTHSYDFKKS